MEHNHLHMLGTAYTKNPPTTVEVANDFLKELVSKINMTVLMGPFSVDCQSIGNEGVTGAVVLEFSHASFHSWHMVERPFFTFDVYSCSTFDPKIVAQHIDEYFELIEIRYCLVDRNNGKNEVIESFPA